MFVESFADFEEFSSSPLPHNLVLQLPRPNPEADQRAKGSDPERCPSDGGRVRFDNQAEKHRARQQ